MKTTTTTAANIGSIIYRQAEYMGKLDEQTASNLYDEIAESLKDWTDKEIHTTIDMTAKNPTRVMRSENFQYFFENGCIVIANKYF